MIEQLEGKNNDKDYELSEQIDTAKEKGITLNVKQDLRKKYEELKSKASTSENHKRCLQSLSKNKCDIINHENDQIKLTIKNVDNQIHVMCQSI